jgi:membrane-associated phospholipid phosphatase
MMPERLAGTAPAVVTPHAGPDRLAEVVSQVTNPAFVALPTFLVVALHTAPNAGVGLRWWLVTTVGISLAPLLHIAQGVRAGRYRDHHLSVRQERLIPFLVGLVSAGTALALLLLWHASRAFLATVAAVVVGAALALVITHGARWKISLHVAGNAGAVTVMVLLFGWPAVLLVPLVPLVGWARWQLRAHTPAQAVAAMLISVAVTVVAFWLFGAL